MNTSIGAPSARDVLQRGEAADRAALVHDVRYELDFELDRDRPLYTGRAVVGFGLRADAREPLFLDFTGRPIRLVVNGRILEPDHHDHRLWLPAELLRSRNRVELEYENPYDTSGHGLHRFADPEDGETYAYSNFEPFSAHRMFPGFDQPDLKATYRLLVTAPRDWRVISTAAPQEVTDVSSGRRHTFPVTPRISTYLFPLVAGPYERVGGEHAGVPLGVLGRRSMARELERSADEIVAITAQGLDYYADLFGRPYPFEKYDQLFVPEFNAGAMENVGAVTFHDRFLFRDPPTYAQRLVRGEVVLHELAHMWFGDLVTMRWWDDLWLNEAFATYLSYRCLADATAFRDAWQVFNGEMRPAAHRQDQLVTTHPVATLVEDTDHAVGNFDAITYEKGAAVIKQLVAAIGDAPFRAGMRLYFDRHAWGNATLADFLAALGEAAGRRLDDWADLWLQSVSLNTIGATWEGAAGRISSMQLQQTAPSGHPVLRPHATVVGLVWQPPGGGPLVVDAIPTRIDGAAQDVPDAVGRPEPLFVYPNHGDHDYALVRLDAASVAFALERLPELGDALLRQQVWSTLWEMVRGATLVATDFLDAVRRFTPGEQDPALLQAVLDRAEEVLRRYVPEGLADVVAGDLVETAFAALHATSGSLRLTWARAAAAFARGPAQLDPLLALADRSGSPPGFDADQELRWQLAVKAAAFGLAEADARLDEERRRDPSDRGQRALIRAEASRPEPSSKASAWDRIHGAGYGSDYRTRAALAGFQWVHQRTVLAPFRVPFYEHVAEVYATRDHAYAGAYARALVPDRWAEPSELGRIRDFTASLGEDQALLHRQLSEVADDLERDIRVRAFAVASLTD
jgi:aminopeptidase N